MYRSDLEPFLNFSNYKNWPSIHTVYDKNNQRNNEINFFSYSIKLPLSQENVAVIAPGLV